MFIKNDQTFICKNCGRNVKRLKYTSRDHCNFCLYSLHVDIHPGDRLNKCGGLLKPINVIVDSKKGEQIKYICTKCGANVKNIIAEDDNKETIYKIIKEYAKSGGR